MGTGVDLCDQRLNVEGDVGIGRQEGNRDRRQRSREKGRPDLAEWRLVLTADQQVIRTVGPGAGHGHPPAASKQVNFYEVGLARQIGAAFAIEEPPALRSGSLV